MAWTRGPCPYRQDSNRKTDLDPDLPIIGSKNGKVAGVEEFKIEPGRLIIRLVE